MFSLIVTDCGPTAVVHVSLIRTSHVPLLLLLLLLLLRRSALLLTRRKHTMLLV